MRRVQISCDICYSFRALFVLYEAELDNSGAPAAEGRQAEPHTHIRKLKGTHELIFSCVSWLAVLLVGAYARRRRRRRRRRRWWSRETWRPQLTRKPKRHVNPWFKASFGHPCCSQLTPVKTRNPLTSIT